MSAIVFFHIVIIICNGHHRPRAWGIVHRWTVADTHGYLSWCQAAPSSANACNVTFGNNAEFVTVG
jgi:hypothetical protein